MMDEIDSLFPCLGKFWMSFFFSITYVGGIALELQYPFPGCFLIKISLQPKVNKRRASEVQHFVIKNQFESLQKLRVEVISWCLIFSFLEHA
jgi:hypothetical protein